MVIVANPVPLKADAEGTIRVAGTRLTLDTVVAAHHEGATPEEIAQRFPGVSLPDVYAVIGYYLRYRDEVEAYLNARREAANSFRQQIEAEMPSRFCREQLLARRAQR
jgi:uncharacterized protein (DUF433 family)